MNAPVPAAVEDQREREAAREPIVHPLTGEVLPDEIDVLAYLEQSVDRYLRRLGKHYAFRGKLRERLADLRGPAVLPRRRYQSDRQQRVAECPRCGHREQG